MSDRPISDVVTDWLRTEASGLPASDPGVAIDPARLLALPQQRYVSQRLLGDDAGRLPLVRWALVLIALAGLFSGIAGVGAVFRQVVDQPVSVPPPEPAIEETAVLPGYRLLSDAGRTTSIQVQTRWRTSWTESPPLGPNELIQARIGSAGLTVSRGQTNRVAFEEFVDAFVQERSAADDWTSFARSDGMHGPHRAVRITPIRSDRAMEQVFYFVQGPSGVPYFVDLAWDPGYTPQELDFDAEAILASFNPDGAYPGLVAPVR